MGIRIYILVILTFTGFLQSVQGQHQPIYKQPAHVFPQTLSWWDSIYMYPSFRQGRITYFTEFTPQQNLLLNYNLYYGQMDLIDSKGDTVRLNPLKTIKSVKIGADVYHLDQKRGYLRIVIEVELTLAAHTLFYTAATWGTDVRGRPSDYGRRYVLSSVYLFLDAKRRSVKPSRAYLRKVFPEYKTAIDEYLRTRSVDFSVGKDLIELAKFCNHLRRMPIDTMSRMVVRAHERASRTLRDSIYRFPSFQNGVVVYQDGSQRSYMAGLNYNLLSGEMDIIERGDTVSIRNSNSIATLNLDGITYFKKSEGYLEVILNGSISLGVTRTIRMIHSQPLEASSKYVNVNEYDGTTANDDVANFDRMYARQNQYYFLDSRGQVHVPSSSALYRLYPSNKKQIDQYITLHQPDLQNEEDLKKLLSYLATIKE
jgi:hypothetical protein